MSATAIIIAWCWASGLIEFGLEADMPQGSIKIAEGQERALRYAIAAAARHGRGANEGKLLVPGVPEAPSQVAAADALDAWLKWCAQGNGEKHRNGVIFTSSSSA